MSVSAAKHEVKGGWRGRLVPWMAVLGVAVVLGWLGLTWYGSWDSAVYEQWAEIRAQYGTLMAQGRPADALALLRRPQDWPAEIQVSRVLLEKDGLLMLGRREEAQALLEQAAKAFPSDPALLNDLGLLYFEKRLFASAAAVLAQGAALVPDDGRLAGNAWMAKVNLALEEAEIQKMVLMSLHRQVEAGLASQGAWVAASHQLEDYYRRVVPALASSGWDLWTRFRHPETAVQVAGFLVDHRIPERFQQPALAFALLTESLDSASATAEVALALVKSAIKYQDFPRARRVLDLARQRYPDRETEWAFCERIMAESTGKPADLSRAYELSFPGLPPGEYWLRGNFDAIGQADELNGWSIIRPVMEGRVSLTLRGPWDHFPKVLLEDASGPQQLIVLPQVSTSTPCALTVPFAPARLAEAIQAMADVREEVRRLFSEAPPPAAPGHPPRLFVILLDGMFWNFLRTFIEAGFLPATRRALAQARIAHLDYGEAPFPFTYVALKTIATGIQADDGRTGNVVDLTIDQIKGFLQRDVGQEVAQIHLGSGTWQELLRTRAIPYVNISLDGMSVFDGMKEQGLDTPAVAGWDDAPHLLRVFLGRTSGGWFGDLSYLVQVVELRTLVRQSVAWWRAMVGLPRCRMAFFWLNETDPFTHRTFYALEEAFAASTAAALPRESLSLIAILQILDVMVEKLLERMGRQDHLIILSDHGIKNNVFHHRHGVWMHVSPAFPGRHAIKARLLDVTPTFLEILGLPIPPSMKGSPLWKVPLNQESDFSEATRSSAARDPSSP